MPLKEQCAPADMAGGSAPAGWPPVSVIISSKDRHTQLEKAVKSILAADYPPVHKEIIILEETDTPQPISGHGVVYKTIPGRNLGYGHGRNQSSGLASHDIIIFTDDDCVVAVDWLKQLVESLLRHPHAVAVGGAVRIPTCGPVGEDESILGFPGGGVLYIHESGGRIMERNTFSTCNCAIRKKAMEEAGGFPDGFVYSGEDEVLSRQIARKHSILYNPSATVYHSPRDSLRAVFRWFIRRGLSQKSILRFVDNPRQRALHILFTSQPLRFLLLLILCWIFRLPLLWVLAAAALLYYTLVLWRYRWSWSYYPSWKTYLLLPVVKIVMDLGMSWGMFQAFLLRK